MRKILWKLFKGIFIEPSYSPIFTIFALLIGASFPPPLPIPVHFVIIIFIWSLIQIHIINPKINNNPVPDTDLSDDK